MKKIIFTTLLALLAAQPSVKAAATTIVDWDFDVTGTQAQGYNTPTPTSGVDVSTATATQLGMNNNYTYNNNEGPGSVAGSDVTSSAGASTGASSYGWRVRGASNNAGGGPGQANGWNSAAPIATQGAQFDASTTGYTSLTLTFDLQVTTQAEQNLAVLYTLNDTASTPTWTNATITSVGVANSSSPTKGSEAVLANNTTSSNTILGNYVQLSANSGSTVSAKSGWNNGITVTFGALAANDPNFAFEIVNASTGADDVNSGGTALNNSSGNWRYDNVALAGTAITTPEPSTWVLSGLGVLALLVVSRRKSSQQ